MVILYCVGMKFTRNVLFAIVFIFFCVKIDISAFKEIIMKEIELKLTRVESVEFVNKLPPNTKIELQNKYVYNVGFSKINACQGEMRAEISDKNSPDRFKIVVVMKGVFTFNNEIAKEKLHVKTFDAMFPFMKAFVVNLTAGAGIPPIYIPYVDISNQSIYRVEMPGNFKKKEKNEDEE